MKRLKTIFAKVYFFLALPRNFLVRLKRKILIFNLNNLLYVVMSSKVNWNITSIHQNPHIPKFYIYKC